MIHRQDHDGIAVLRIEHGKANAVDIDLFEGLEAQLETLASDGTKAVVITGSGSNFSAGVDLFQVLDGGSAYLKAFLPVMSRGLLALFEFDKPVVAAVNGHAIAGGCILALACDRRLMAECKGRMGVTELRVGVPFPVAPMEVLRFALPDRVVQDLVYSGRLLAVDDAHRLGLVDEVVDQGELIDRSIDAARKLAAIPTRAFALTKSHLREATRDRIAQYQIQREDQIAGIWSDPETLAGIQAFMDTTVGKK